MPSKKSMPDVFSTNIVTEPRRTASLSSYRARLPSSKLFQIFGSSSSHRRSASDTGPNSFGNFKRSISPSGSTLKKTVLRKTRSEGRSLKDIIPSASTWLEDFTAKIVNPNAYQKRKDLYESFTLKACEEDSWTEVVKQKEGEKTINKNNINTNHDTREDTSRPSSVLEFQPTSPLNHYFIERDLDPIKEVEDQRQIRTSFIDHGRSVSYDQGLCVSAGIKTVGPLSVSELGVPEVSAVYQPLSSYKPVQCIPHKGTPSKPYNQATGYLFTDTRPKSRSSYPSPWASPSISKSHARYSYQDPKPFYRREEHTSLYDEFEEEKPNEDHGSIRLVSIGTKEIESTTLSRLPRIDPSRSISSSYVAHRSLAKDDEDENDQINLASSQISSTSTQTSIINHVPVKSLYQEPESLTMNFSKDPSTSTFGKKPTQINPQKRQYRSSLNLPVPRKRNQSHSNDENWNNHLVDSSSALRGKIALYKRNSSFIPNETHTKTQGKEVMSGLINLINL